ncbi:MAG: hypothetical protein M3R43_03115, partial [Acidobacteriota bacterium]|nr:hypothetical protein [Acidobacteriota bacterium]
MKAQRSNSLSSQVTAVRYCETISARMCILSVLVLGAAQTLAGCGANTIIPAASPEVVRLSGNVHGGNQPVVGSHIFLYAVSTTANGGASTSLLNAPGFVITDGNGGFSITSDYTCPTGGYVYLLALGGNPGLAPSSVNNAELAMASGVGAC